MLFSASSLSRDESWVPLEASAPGLLFWSLSMSTSLPDAGARTKEKAYASWRVEGGARACSRSLAQ